MSKGTNQSSQSSQVWKKNPHRKGSVYWNMFKFMQGKGGNKASFTRQEMMAIATGRPRPAEPPRSRRTIRPQCFRAVSLSRRRFHRADGGAAQRELGIGR